MRIYPSIPAVPGEPGVLQRMNFDLSGAERTARTAPGSQNYQYSFTIS